jgi:uncharacterized membrane protein YadS
VIKAKETEVAIAVSNVVVFGAFGMLCYPHLAHTLFSHGGQAGMFLGLGIHDTSQVVGAAASYASTYGDALALKVAVITKLTRNVCLAGVMFSFFFFFFLFFFSQVLPYFSLEKGEFSRALLIKHTPTFVLLFLGASLFRSTGDYFFSSVPLWSSLTYTIGTLCPLYLLNIAMGGVGLAIQPRKLFQYGWRPFAVGGLGALLVASTGLMSAHLVGDYL